MGAAMEGSPREKEVSETKLSTHGEKENRKEIALPFFLLGRRRKLSFGNCPALSEIAEEDSFRGLFVVSGTD